MASFLPRVLALCALLNLCSCFSVPCQIGIKSKTQAMMNKSKPPSLTALFAKSKKSKPKEASPKVQPAEPSESTSNKIPDQASAQAAAKAAESFNLFETDKEEQTRKSQNRIDKFERELRDVVVRQKSTDELDTRGTRLEGTEKSDQLDDSKIRDLLLGKSKPPKEEKKDRLRTETGADALSRTGSDRASGIEIRF